MAGLLKSTLCCATSRPLLTCALCSSLAWYMFWVVMAPVEKDISHLFNWYFFIKLNLEQLYDMYGVLASIHHWTPLFIVVITLLSKISPVFPSALDKLAQMTFVLVTLYNSLLFVYLLSAGGKVTALFSLTLPLRLALSLGPWFTALFVPHKLFIPVSILIGAHLLYCYCCHSCSSVCEGGARNKIRDDPPMVRLVKRLMMFGLPFIILLLATWIMSKGCHPCFPINTHHSNETPPQRPKLIAHRGCGQNGPENSQAAFEQASQLPSMIGLETDVQISLDGVPFLLHDPHLVRTTNVRERCPSIDPLINASLLNYTRGECSLGDLNVGTWFTKENLDSLARNLFLSFSRQTLPKFSQFLSVAKQSGKIVIFDVIEPPVGHTHYSRYLNITLDAVVRSGIDISKVWWLPRASRAWVIKHFPEMVQITKTKDTKFEEFPSDQIQLVNDDWTTSIELFRTYQTANISINMFFVESPLMYSYAWCLGINSVTTDNCQQLANVNSNVLYQVCYHWYRQLLHPSVKEWWTGCTILLLLLGIVLCWDKLFTRLRR